MDNNNEKKVEVVLKQDKSTNKGLDISLKLIIDTLLKGKFIIAAAVILCILLAFAASMYMQYLKPFQGSVSMIVTFNFSGIEKGLDPYGNDFDISKAKSPEVLSKVIENLGLSSRGITEDNLRTNIKFTPIIPGNITERIKSLQEAKTQNVVDTQDFTYYPNTYLVNLNLPRTFAINSVEAREILDEIFKQYKKYFYKSYYNGPSLVEDVGPTDYTKYDYPQQIEMLKGQFTTLENYLKTKSGEVGANTFRSKKNGVTFNDIVESLVVLDKVDVQNIGAIIDSYNLTKDKDALIKLYEFRIQECELTSKKKNDEAGIYSNSIKNYQKDKNLLVIPDKGATIDSNSIETNQTSKYYDELIEKSITAKSDARTAIHDSDYYKEQIAKLKSDTVEVAKKKEAEKKVVAMLEDTRNKFKEYMTIANDTVNEYYNSELFKRAMTIISPPEYVKTKTSMKLYLAIGALAGLFVGAFFILLKEYLKLTEKKTENKTESNTDVAS